MQSGLEPEPSLDYNTIYMWAVRLAPAIKDRAEKKKFLEAFEDVAEARSNYHRCCLENQKAHNKLQDASLFHKMMTGRKEEIEKQIEQWQEKEVMRSVQKEKEKELETIKWQIKKNNESGPALLINAKNHAHTKARVSMHFVDMKVSLIKNYLPQMETLERRYLMAIQYRAVRMRMAKGSYCSHVLNRFSADHQQGPQPTGKPIIDKQALRLYHQATHGKIVNRTRPSPELARAIEQARKAVGQGAAGPPESTS